MKHKIGILGGMGPEATSLILSRVIDMTAAEDDADHIPMLIDNNTQIPSRIKALIEKTGESPAPTLINMARKLEANGAKALAMPCNTAHCYAEDIQQAVNIPLLNMVNLSLKRIKSIPLSNHRIGILGSPAIKLSGLFDRTFSSQSIECVYPDNQENMLIAIKGIKKNKADSNAIKILTAAVDEIAFKKIDAILIACSEFSIIANSISKPLCCIDTINVLAEAIIEFSSH